MALPLLKGPEPPDALVTDVVLGAGMSGIELAEAARAAPLLAKPSTLSQLDRALHAVSSDSRSA